MLVVQRFVTNTDTVKCMSNCKTCWVLFSHASCCSMSRHSCYATSLNVLMLHVQVQRIVKFLCGVARGLVIVTPGCWWAVSHVLVRRTVRSRHCHTWLLMGWCHMYRCDVQSNSCVELPVVSSLSHLAGLTSVKLQANLSVSDLFFGLFMRFFI